MDRAAYMKGYRADYKKRVKIVKTTMPLSLYTKLEARAKEEGIRPATLAREIIEAGLDHETRLPSHIQGELRAFRFLVRNISNNINQLAHHSNTIKRVANERGLFQWLKQLEGHVLAYTTGRLKSR